MSLEQERARGANAKSIVEDDLFNESFESVRANILYEWANTNISGGTEQREFLYLMLKAADKFKEGLVSMIDTGKLATIQLESDKAEK
jgi:hypothetical protein